MKSLLLPLQHFWHQSIRRQLVLGIVLVHSVLMFLFVFDLVERQRSFLHSQSLEQSISLASTVAANSVSWVLANDYLGLEEVIQSVSKYPGIRHAMVLSGDGRVLAHNKSDVVGQYVTDSLSLQLLHMQPSTQILTNNDVLQDVATPIFSNQEHIGWARVGISVEQTMAGLEVITRNGFIYILVAIVVGTGFAILMARGITSDLKTIVNVTSKIREGKSEQRVNIERNDELGELVNNFNHMLDVLHSQTRDKEKAWQELKQHRDHLEEMVAQRTKALEVAKDNALLASRVKSEFLANMSHELRTPLNSIIGFTSIIKDGFAGEVNDTQQEQLTIVNNSAKHLLTLINDVLDLSKIEAGKGEVFKEAVPIAELLTELAGFITPQVKAKGLNLNMQPCSDVSEIVTDKGKLLQILINLLSNAIKFTESGSITVECCHVADQLEIRVSDTGIGISHDQKDNIFDAFSQVHRGDSRQYEGTGLGLTITRNFVRLLGGNIYLESELGKGSTFIVSLPLN